MMAILLSGAYYGEGLWDHNSKFSKGYVLLLQNYYLCSQIKIYTWRVKLRYHGMCLIES